MVEVRNLRRAKPAEALSSEHAARGAREDEGPATRQSSMVDRRCEGIVQCLAGGQWGVQEDAREPS
eukprot:2915729-Pyramimonas_sp.AAC.1